MTRRRRMVESEPFDWHGSRVYPPTAGYPAWRVVVPTADGTPLWRTALDLTEAKQLAEQYEDVACGLRSELKGRRSVAALADAYLTSLDGRVKMHAVGLDDGVTVRYRERQEQGLAYIIPRLGTTEVRNWTDPKQCKEVLVAAANAGRAKGTIEIIGSVMRQLVTFAHDDGWLSRLIDPMAGVHYTQRSSRQGKKAHFVDRNTLPEDHDIDRLIKGFVMLGEQWRWPGAARWALAVDLTRRSGLRYGELIGLRPCDLDFDHDVILVDEQIVQPRRGPFFRDLPKWGKTRTAPFTESLHTTLTELSAVVEASEGREGLLFPGEPLKENDRRPWPCAERKWFGRRWIRAAQLAGWELDPKPRDPQWPCARWTLHDLRHFFACWMGFDTEWSWEDVSYFMGHSSVSFTLDTYVGPRGDPEGRVKRMMAGW